MASQIYDNGVKRYGTLEREYGIVRTILGVNSPRVRSADDFDPDDITSGVTRQESMWIVIVGLSIAAMRYRILVDHDVEWYILRFFCFWGPVSASVMYSNRFNDDDSFHKMLWFCFLVFMILQAGSVHNDTTAAFSGATCALYSLIGGAYVRSAAYLRHARVLCGFYGGQCLVAAILFAYIWFARVQSVIDTPIWVRILLWCHVGLEPVRALVFAAYTTDPNHRKHDIVLDIPDLLKRFDSFKMKIIVCSLIFPIGLQGPAFVASRTSAIAVLLANTYALLLKLATIDLFSYSEEPTWLHLHALRRTRATAVLFAICFPFGLLGMSLTGVGFVAVISQSSEALARSVLCGGAALTGAIDAFKLLLQGSSEEQSRLHHAKTLAFALCAAAFALPLAFHLSLMLTVVVVVMVEISVILFNVLLHRWFEGGLPNKWKWNEPRLETEKHFSRLASVVSQKNNHESQEIFFNGLVGICIFALNQELMVDYNVEACFLRFALLYVVLMSCTRYAARFNDDDLAHKLNWSLLEFVLLLMLLGLGAPDGGTGRWALFKVAAAGVFFLLGFAFWGRMAAGIPKVRGFCLCGAMVQLTCAVLMLYTCLTANRRSAILWAVCLISTSAQLWMACIRLCIPEKLEEYGFQFAAPNLQYMIKRFDDIFMEVLCVALLVPKSMDLWDSTKAGQAIVATLLSVILAVMFKMQYFDMEFLDVSQHAASQSGWHRYIYFAWIHTFLLAGLVGTGAGLPRLIHAVADPDLPHKSFVRRLVCGSVCLVWLCLGVANFGHSPASPHIIHNVKAVVQFLGSALMMLPLAAGLDDLQTTIAVVAASVMIVFVQRLLLIFVAV